jgi:type IX secretion system PorP/SprF family membrane protein
MRKQIYFHVTLKQSVLCLLSLLWMISSKAQDIHYAQYWNTPTNINPALTGVFRGDTRFFSNYRTQWNTVPVEYITFTGAIDHKFPIRGNRNGYFAGGLTFNYDQAGLARLNLSTLCLSGSYTHQLSNASFATAGVSANINQRGFNLEGLTFDRQYDPSLGIFNPNAANGENFANLTRVFPAFAAGLNIRMQSQNKFVLVDELAKRSRIDFGAGLFHFNQPDHGFIRDQKTPLRMRISPYILGVLMVSKKCDLIGNFNAQFQGPNREMNAMMGFKVHLNTLPGEQFAVQAGMGYRFHEISDAIIPGIEIQSEQWMLGFSYDINISAFNVATLRRGGPEFSLRYIISKVPVLSTFKVCPLI